jgi:hypothetical protein
VPLTLALKEGDGFNVGPYEFKITRILSATQFRLRRLPGNEFVDIDDQHAKEVAPRVFVMSGTRGQATLARVAIEADPSFKISRQQLSKPSNRIR